MPMDLTLRTASQVIWGGGGIRVFVGYISLIEIWPPTKRSCNDTIKLCMESFLE